MAWTNPTPDELAADWISAKKGDASGLGPISQFLLVDFPSEEPELTWQATVIIVESYPEEDYYAAEKTEAQATVGVLAAGPVEDLLSFHGEAYIDRFEAAAQSDRRWAWLLGGVWQAQMTDEIWKRVQNASDDTYWKRRA